MISNQYLKGFIYGSFFRNVSALSVSEIIIRFSKFILIAYAARILGPNDFGLFNYALALAALIAVLGDFGINKIITRNISKDETMSQYYLGSFMAQVIVITFYILVGSGFLYFTADPRLTLLFLILALFSGGNILGDYLWSFFRARQTMVLEAIGKTVQALLVLVVGVILLKSSIPLYGLALSYAIAAFATLTMAIWGIQAKLSLKPFIISWKSWRELLTQSWPIAIVAVSAFVFNEVDSIMLGAAGYVREVGYYNAAYKIVSGLLIPAFIINQVVYPKFAASPSRNKLVKKNFIANLIIYSFFLVLVIYFARPIIVTIYGQEYISAVRPLIILCIATVASALVIPLANYSIAMNQLKINLWLSVSAAILNIVLNFVLIPPLLSVGAAVATTVTYLFLLIGYSMTWYRLGSYSETN